jgi:hypothetical protein
MEGATDTGLNRKPSSQLPYVGLVNDVVNSCWALDRRWTSRPARDGWAPMALAGILVSAIGTGAGHFTENRR